MMPKNSQLDLRFDSWPFEKKQTQTQDRLDEYNIAVLVAIVKSWERQEKQTLVRNFFNLD